MDWKALTDCFVVCLYFALIIGIGISQRSKSGSVEGFTLGDRQIAWWAVLASILAAEISAATFLGAPESGYARLNWTYLQFAIGTVMARIIVSFVFIPVFYKHGVISLYEFLGNRFGKISRVAASGTFLVTRVLAMGTRLYVAAIILVIAYAAFKDRPVSADEKFWIFAVALIVISLLTALYTTVGGIRAVIWTDFIQVGVLVAALGFTITYLLWNVPGGWSGAMEHVKEPVFWNVAKPEEPGALAWIINVFTSDYTIWAAFIGSTFVTMATHGIDQDTVQRMLTAKNRKESARATILSGLVDIPIVFSFVLIGVLLYAFYQSHPAKAAGLPADTKEIFPHFILHEMPAGIRGLVIAGILATAMGSLSTALNALATSFARDFVFPRMKGEVTEARSVRVLRWSTVLFAVFIIAVGVWTAWYMAHNPKAEIIPLVLGILGFTFGSLLALFLVAIFTKSRGSDVGNVIAMACGIAAVIWLSIADLNPAKAGDQPLAFPWRVTLGTLVTGAVALCFRTPQKMQDAARFASGQKTGLA
jgi:SSS family solute:Na+ symporter